MFPIWVFQPAIPGKPVRYGVIFRDQVVIHIEP
jgi:hypothetical protein